MMLVEHVSSLEKNARADCQSCSCPDSSRDMPDASRLDTRSAGRNCAWKGRNAMGYAMACWQVSWANAMTYMKYPLPERCPGMMLPFRYTMDYYGILDMTLSPNVELKQNGKGLGHSFLLNTVYSLQSSSKLPEENTPLTKHDTGFSWNIKPKPANPHQNQKHIPRVSKT